MLAFAANCLAIPRLILPHPTFSFVQALIHIQQHRFCQKWEYFPRIVHEASYQSNSARIELIYCSLLQSHRL